VGSIGFVNLLFIVTKPCGQPFTLKNTGKKVGRKGFTTSKHHKVSRETKTLKAVFYLTNCAKFDSRLILA
jgi:hypothetical protein